MEQNKEEILIRANYVFHKWNTCITSTRLPETLKRTLIRLYWEWVEKHKEIPSVASYAEDHWKFNRWEHNQETGVWEMKPDDRLVRCFHINNEYIFKRE